MNSVKKQNQSQRIAYVIIFSALFSIIGRLLPEIYLRYADKTQYITVDSPVSIDKNYFKPCDKVVLTSSLEALADLDTVIRNQLVLVKDDGTEYQLTDSLIQVYAPIRKAEPHTVSYPYPLPCNIEDGRYFWKGTITYHYRDVEKTVGFISQTFNVTQTGLSPSAQEAIEKGIDDSK